MDENIPEKKCHTNGTKTKHSTDRSVSRKVISDTSKNYMDHWQRNHNTDGCYVVKQQVQKMKGIFQTQSPEKKSKFFKKKNKSHN